MNLATLNAVREQVDQRDDKGVYDIRLCFRCELYFSDFSREPKGVAHFYETVLPLIRDSIRWYDVDGKRRPKKIKPEAFDMIPFWAGLNEEGRTTWGLTLESGATKDEVSDCAFNLFSLYLGSLGAGELALYLPIEYLIRDGLDVVALLKEATRELGFLHGTAGFGININPDYPSDDEEFAVYALSRRYRGIEVNDPGWFSQYANQGIPNINWLTLIGSDLVERLGGPAALDPLRAEDIRIHKLEHGLMIQAGAEPSFGNVNRDETLDAYHAVGRALCPLRLKTGRVELWDSVGGQENTQEWLARFDT